LTPQVHQLKANFTNVDSLASEMVAFSNSGGGMIVIGVNDNGTITGLGRDDMGRLTSSSLMPPRNPCDRQSTRERRRWFLVPENRELRTKV